MKPTTGTLCYRGGTWQVRVRSKPQGSEKTQDVYLDTETSDEGLARQRQPGVVKKYLEGLGKPAIKGSSKLIVPRVTMTEVAASYYPKRQANGVKSWKDERRHWDLSIKSILGNFEPKNVTTSDIERVLLAAKQNGYSKETIKKIWLECFRLMKEARKAGHCPTNVADRELVEMPRGKVDERKRQQPTDEEFWVYLDHPDTFDYSEVENRRRRERGEPELISLEVKTLAVVSRIIGGARTSDLHALDWSRVDVDEWTTLQMYRLKSVGGPAIKSLS